jgi:uncharacterized membrane protein YagU involved in acid resistance
MFATLETTSGSLTARLIRGAVAGVASGLVFAAATMWFASSMPDGSAEMPLHMIATVVQGDDAMAAGTTNVAVGVVVHLVLSALFGMVFALIAPRLRTNQLIAVGGHVYGALLYVLNFAILAPLVFNTFELANQPFELVVHVVFGSLLALAFLHRERPTT